MKFKTALISICLFFNLSYSSVITGELFDSTSGKPVDSARIMFRLGRGQDEYPVIYSDPLGRFRSVLDVEMNYPLDYVIEKDGYFTKILNVEVDADSINLGRIIMEQFVSDMIFFCGVVVDSLTEAPLENVGISLQWNAGDFAEFHRLGTDSVGHFQGSFQMPDIMNRMVSWKIVHSGYYISHDFITAEMDSVPQTIRLKPLGSIRVEAKGTVVDSLTRAPVENATVFLQTTFFNARQDTSCTGKDGVFIRSIEAGQVSSSYPEVECVILAEGYETGVKYLPVLYSLEDVGFGEIGILKDDTHVRRPVAGETRISRNENLRVFDLNGRQLKSRDGITSCVKNWKRPASRIIVIVEESPDKGVRKGKTVIAGF